MSKDYFTEARPSTLLENPTKHVFVGWGYDTTECKFCHADSYSYKNKAVPNDYCEDFEWAKLEWQAIQDHRHAATEAAIDVARAALTREQWELLGLNRVRAYRDKDYLRL